ELRTAKSFGRSQPLATVTVGPPLSPDQTEALRFNPWTTGPGIHSSGWLNLLRDAAYQASQRGRVRNTPTPGLVALPHQAKGSRPTSCSGRSAQRAAADRRACRWQASPDVALPVLAAAGG